MVQVLWWDTRQFSAPVDSLILDPHPEDEASAAMAQGATILGYEWTIPSKFMVGTQQGESIK